jgi:hypothetical protein
MEIIMANADLQAESACTNPASVRGLYHAYRYAKAVWDAAAYAPATLDDGLPGEVDTPLSDAHSTALEAFMLAPCASLFELSLKLDVYREEDLHEWHRAREFADQLCRDARRVSQEARHG